MIIRAGYLTQEWVLEKGAEWGFFSFKTLEKQVLAEIVKRLGRYLNATPRESREFSCKNCDIKLYITDEPIMDGLQSALKQYPIQSSARFPKGYVTVSPKAREFVCPKCNLLMYLRAITIPVDDTERLISNPEKTLKAFGVPEFYVVVDLPAPKIALEKDLDYTNLRDIPAERLRTILKWHRTQKLGVSSKVDFIAKELQIRKELDEE